MSARRTASAANPDPIMEWVERLQTGEIRLRDLPTELSHSARAEIRRRLLESQAGMLFDHVADFSFDAERVGATNCENLIGVTQIPLGVAGPLTIRGEFVDSDERLWVPLATTEGALVASVNRGCRATTEAGGVEVDVEDVGITRAPVFRVENRAAARSLIGWVEANTERIREAAESTSHHLTMLEIRPQVIGTSVFLRFRFLTDDAMGMNMATIACDHVVRELIAPETGVECVALSGNFCVDKKPSMVNFLEGRGKRLHAAVAVSSVVLDECLKTDAKSMLQVQTHKNFVGSIAAGSLAYNAHFANVLSAFFVATGQDPAQVAEAAVGVTTMEAAGDGIRLAVDLPDVPLGAIGGGTGLATQAECLRLLGVRPDPAKPAAAAMRLAEILAAAVLCGELSLLAALTTSDLAGAHRRLARRNPSD